MISRILASHDEPGFGSVINVIKHGGPHLCKDIVFALEQEENPWHGQWEMRPIWNNMNIKNDNGTHIINGKHDGKIESYNINDMFFSELYGCEMLWMSVMF